jgi:hypothetical protein
MAPSSVGVTKSGVSLISLGLDPSQPLLSQEHCSKMASSSYPLAHGCQIFRRVARPIRSDPWTIFLYFSGRGISEHGSTRERKRRPLSAARGALRRPSRQINS